MDESLANFEMPESEIKGTDEQPESSSSPENISESELGRTSGGSGDGDDLNGSPEGETEGPRNIDEILKTLPPNTVSFVRHAPTNTEVYIVGTAHFSKESCQDVVQVISTVQPHLVFVELCGSRVHVLTQDEDAIIREAQAMTTQKLLQHISNDGFYNGMMYFLMLKMSANITKQTGMAPGGEFRAAYGETIKIKDCELLLGDRPLHITMKRALARLTWWQTIKIAWHVLVSNDKVSAEDIENCKQKDMLEQLLNELSTDYEAFKDVFLTERDIFLTSSIHSAIFARARRSGVSSEKLKKNPIRMVVVVGIGHVAGIQRLWTVDQTKAALKVSEVPPPSVTSKVVRLAIRSVLIVGGAYAIYRFVRVPPSLKENAVYTMKKLSDGLLSSRISVPLVS